MKTDFSPCMVYIQMDLGPYYKNNFEEKVLSRTLVLSSKTPNSFSIQLPTRIYNVVGIKLHAVEFQGDVSPLKHVDGSAKPFVIFLNDYNQVISNNQHVDGAYARISTHTIAGPSYVKFHSHAANPFDDVYSYLFNPNSTSVDRFNIEIRDESGMPFFPGTLANDVTVTVSLFVYYRYSKGNM